jgi:ectoine hydroxylase
MASILSPDDVARYHDDGFIFVRGLFDAEETDLLRRAMEEDPAIREHSLLRADQEGGATRISLWNRAGDSVYGLAARSARLVDSVEALIGEPVYHFQSKLTAKDPKVGGAWEWHQDYGYWYHNGCVWPDMASVMVALDRATRENGCLQVLRGSHRAGRVDHGVLPGEQVGADPRRVEEMKKRMDLVHCEMEPGDGLFFHANVMHRSDQNRSPNRRWTVLFCFNAARNDPYLDHHHPHYTPLVKMPDTAIKEAGLRFASGDRDENFRRTFANPPELKRRLG